MEDKVMEKTKPIEPVLIEYKDKENFGIDTVTGTRGRNNTLGINHSLDGVGSGLIKCRTLEVLIDKIIEKNKKTRRKQYHYYFNYSLPVSFTPFFSTKGNGESGYNAKRKRRQSKISSLSPKFLTRCYN